MYSAVIYASAQHPGCLVRTMNGRPLAPCPKLAALRRYVLRRVCLDSWGSLYHSKIRAHHANVMWNFSDFWNTPVPRSRTLPNFLHLCSLTSLQITLTIRLLWIYPSQATMPAHRTLCTATRQFQCRCMLSFECKLMKQMTKQKKISFRQWTWTVLPRKRRRQQERRRGHRLLKRNRKHFWQANSPSEHFGWHLVCGDFFKSAFVHTVFICTSYCLPRLMDEVPFLLLPPWFALIKRISSFHMCKCGTGAHYCSSFVWINMIQLIWILRLVC